MSSQRHRPHRPSQHPRPHRAPHRHLHRHPRRRLASSSGRSCSPTACARRSTTCSPQISQNVDLRVRPSVAFGDDEVDVQRDPIPARCCRPSRASTASPPPSRSCSATPRSSTPDGEVVEDAGRADARRGVDGQRGRCRASTSRVRARRRRAPDQVAIDKATADREDLAVGDQIQVITDTGTYPFTITALVGLGDSDGFAGATLAAWDVATAQQVTGAGDQYDAHRHPASPTAPTRRRCTAALEQVLPERHRGRRPRDDHRGEQGPARPDHQRLRQRPARLRLRHRLRQRLPDQQRLPDHDRPAAARAGADARRRRHLARRCAG